MTLRAIQPYVFKKMDPVVKVNWIEALRSGLYKRGTDWLKSIKYGETVHCCLGVLTELYPENLKCQKNFDVFTFGEYADSGTLPTEVKNWAGLSRINPIIAIVHGQPVTAGYANDNLGWTFDQIADAIEENL